MSKDLFKKLNNEEEKTIFVACDTSNLNEIKKIINQTKNK